MENIILGIIISIALPIVFGLFYKSKEKEEKKMLNNTEIVIKSSKGIQTFFLVWMIICFIGMIGAVILLVAYEEPNEAVMFWIIEFVVLGFFLMGAFGFGISKYNYIVVKKYKIIINKLFSKPREIKYSDITYYKVDIAGGISCYDSNGVVMLAVDDLQVGVNELQKNLLENGCISLPELYPTEEMKINPKFQQYSKYSSLTVSFWCFIIFGIASIGLGFLVQFLSNYTEFENFEKSGIVENYKRKGDIVEIYLEDDENLYFINNIIYPKLDKDIFEVLKPGKEIKFHIGYINEYDRYIISQIEIDDTIYLNMSLAEYAEYSNYKYGVITGYVFMGIGGLLLLLSIVYYIIIRKMKNTLLEYDKSNKENIYNYK